MSRRELQTVRQVFTLLQWIHIHPVYFIAPICFSILAAAFEGAGMGLLIPLLNGFLTQDYSFITHVPVLHRLLEWLPASITSRDRTLFIFLLALFASMIIGKNVFRYLGSLGMAYLSSRALHHLRKQIFNEYLTFGKQYFDTSSIGQHATLLSRFTEQAIVPLTIVDKVMQAILSLTVYIVMMSVISWKLTLFALPLFSVLHMTIRQIIRKIRSLSSSLAVSMSNLGKSSVDILSVIPLVKANNMEEDERLRFSGISDRAARLEFHRAALQKIVGPIQELISLCAILLLFGGMMYLLVQEKHIAVPSFLVYFYLVLNAANKFSVLTSFRGDVASVQGPVDAVMALLDSKDKKRVPDGTRVFDGLRDRIVFKELTFGYAGGRRVLHGVSFDIPAGTTVALVGPTGAGKTTITSLLLRFYDCAPGSIMLDGVDIREFSVASLRRKMAIVSQETLLLHDTIRRNISYGVRDIDDRTLHDVVRRARLEEFIASLPEGLETLIGDRGVKLSGGEKQRLSIARALLKGADILILDEATSSLDSTTERLIQEAVEEAISGKTAIVIAHRLSTIKHADKIVVIEHGRIVGDGTLDELLRDGGTFHALWEAQKFS